MSIIRETLEKIKPFYSLLVILLISSIFFALGRISVTQTPKTPINIAYSNINQTASAIITSTSTPKTIIGKVEAIDKIPLDGGVIGSKSGKKYYFPWCGTVRRIKPENQVKFNSITEARNAGFTAGGNCKGLI